MYRRRHCGREADEATLWTDVDGILTADPRLVPEASSILEMSYREASELAELGAKVLPSENSATGNAMQYPSFNAEHCRSPSPWKRRSPRPARAAVRK